MNPTPFVLHHCAAALQPVQAIGGKAAGLAALARAGAPVPAWICVTSQAFEAVSRTIAARAAGLFASLRHGMPAKELRNCAQALRALVADSPLPEELEGSLAAACDEAFPDCVRFAVRSSAIEEDGAHHSFAGQFDTFLHVARADLKARVSETMASLYSDRAVAYRLARGIDNRSARVAVVVQQMVDSHVAGVLFTANPASGDRTEAVLSAGLGLGEGVVDGSVETDMYYADLETGRLRRRDIACKQLAVRTDDASGTALRAVPPELRDAPVLADAEVAGLVRLARAVAFDRAAPQDIEWALDAQRRPYLLQARPITTLDRARESVFDNANVVESYPGVSLPLTFSFVQENYRDAFREAGRRFGVQPADLRRLEPVFGNLVALIEGRIYYNILNWYEMFHALPGMERALPAWEKALGLASRNARTSPPSRRFAAAAGQARMAFTLLRRFIRLRSDVTAFAVGFAELENQVQRRAPEELDAHQALELVEALAERIRAPYAVAIVNDFFVQQFHELLTRLIARFHDGPPEALRNGLLCGEQGMESVDPVRSLLAIAEVIRGDAPARALFESPLSERAIWDRLTAAAPSTQIRDLLLEHLRRYGARMPCELQLETPAPEDDPRFLVAMLRNYLRGNHAMGAVESREREIRSAAQRTLEAALPRRCARRLVFDFVLAQCRRELVYRENLRLARGRAYGMARRLYRALGGALARSNLIRDSSDIFYLTTGEVAAAVRGHSVTRDLAALVALRRAEYDALPSGTPDGRITVRGIVHAARAARSAATGVGERQLQGTGCSPGCVSAPAKVVLQAERGTGVDGEILVAPMTDPGWVFLMVAARGLISERGSPLSHTAIIGRELGIPTIVGLEGATQRIPDGATLQIDGDRGTVVVLTAGGLG